MKRKCNLELRLLPPYESFNPLSPDFDTQCPSMLNNEISSSRTIKKHQEHQQKQMTIFYNGQMAVSEVTELQARAIIELASREMEERSTSPINSSSSPSTPLIQPHTPSPSTMSMKRSLQRFLQKRKNRTQAASPYHHQLAS